MGPGKVFRERAFSFSECEVLRWSRGWLQWKGMAPRNYFLICMEQRSGVDHRPGRRLPHIQPELEGWHPALSASPDVFLPLCSHILPGRLGILQPPGRPLFQCLPGRALLTSADIARLPCPPGHMPLQRSWKAWAQHDWGGRFTLLLERTVVMQKLCAQGWSVLHGRGANVWYLERRANWRLFPYPSPNEKILPIPPANQVQRDWEQRNKIVPPDVGKMSSLWGAGSLQPHSDDVRVILRPECGRVDLLQCLPMSLKVSTSPSIFCARWASLHWLPFPIRAPSGPERLSPGHLYRYQHSSATKMWLNLASLSCAHPLTHIAHISVPRGRGVRADRWPAQLVPSWNHKLQPNQGKTSTLLYRAGGVLELWPR